MSYIIAITGKGGVGKTTIAGLLISRLAANGLSPVLAVDADPNSCLDTVLGAAVKNTVGRIREDVRNQASTGKVTGIAKQQLLEMKIEESLVEADKFDLIAMGRPEGPGCYCFANNVLKDVISKLSSGYPYMVIDNEAGLENLSRRIVKKVNLLAMVTVPTKNGLDTVRRLHQLALEMKIEFDKLCIFVNRVRSETHAAHIEELGKDTNADFIVELPENQDIISFSEKGKDLLSLPPGNELIVCIDNFLKKLFKEKLNGQRS